MLELADDPPAMDAMRSIAPVSEHSWNRSANRDLLTDFFERVFAHAVEPQHARRWERRRLEGIAARVARPAATAGRSIVNRILP